MEFIAIKLSNLIGESRQNFASVFVALSPFAASNLHVGRGLGFERTETNRDKLQSPHRN